MVLHSLIDRSGQGFKMNFKENTCQRKPVKPKVSISADKETNGSVFSAVGKLSF